jgi:VacB/RNase II family 3'-5' exoribonuclease
MYVDLEEIAREALKERGFSIDFEAPVEREAKAARETTFEQEPADDLRSLLWFSIDNDDSRDLDQLSCAERDGSNILLRVAVADVDHPLPKDSESDRRARNNTTSIYTPPAVFPMIHPRFSTDLTSLNEAEDRLAIVAEMTIGGDGEIVASTLRRAWVHNHAKLAYDSVAAWLDGSSAMPPKVAASEALAESLRLHNEVADSMRVRRQRFGALDLETIEPRAAFENGRVTAIQVQKKNEARMIIEDLMIAANGVTAAFLEQRGFATIRRIVRSPERWEKIRSLAEEKGHALPSAPDSHALEQFLVAMRKQDPLRFPDLSLSIVKLMGSGEYAVEIPGTKSEGHFGLAVRDYTHSTAPNRRYPDLITQRIVKAALANRPSPYSVDELEELAAHCSDREDEANKVERIVRKAAAAMYLSDDVGKKFDGIVTGASSKGTWVRIFAPPAEGKVVRGAGGLDVGDRVRVRLVRTDPYRGFIDFEL